MKTRTFYIAGVKFHKSAEVIDELKVGDVLELNPDPSNKWDSNAVEIVYYAEDAPCMLGFVPARLSGEISAAIEISNTDESNIQITCTITQVTPSAKPWERIEVEIKEV